MVLNSARLEDHSLYKLVLIQFALLFLHASGSPGDKMMVNDFPNHQNRAGKLYFAIAASSTGQAYGRAFNKTLANITQSYLATAGQYKDGFNFTLETLVIELPENGSFSATLLETLCGQFEGKNVMAVLVVGESPAAFTVSLAAKHSGIPVLWARGHGGLLPAFRSSESSPLEVQLAPTGRELVQALRLLLMHAHWHTFTLLVDPASASTLRRPELWATLSAQPLHPTLITLPSPLRAQSLFRKLADISRSTRGVVVLLSDRPVAVRILQDAQRLNMMDGHFVWLWIDTNATTTAATSKSNSSSDDERAGTAAQGPPPPPDLDRLKRDSDVVVPSDISDMHVNYLLRNDQFLLFNSHTNNNYYNNRNYGVESSKPKKTSSNKRERREGPARRFFNNVNHVETSTTSSTVNTNNVNSNHNYRDELPTGLLSLRPVPVKVDRHLVKGAVRLLVAALKAVLDRTPVWVLENVASGKHAISCWKNPPARQYNFSGNLGRELKSVCTDALAGKKFTQEIGVDKVDKSLVANFEILNLVPERGTKDIVNPTTATNEQFANRSTEGENSRWKRVGLVSGHTVRLDTIIWPGGDLAVAAVSQRARTVFRVVTALAPPFVMESELDEDGQCLRGLPCHRVLTSDKDNLTLVFNEMQRLEDEEDDAEDANFGSDYEEDDRFLPFQKFKYRTNCCYGLAMDLLENVAQELEFDFRLYIVADGVFGSKFVKRRKQRDLKQKYTGYRYKNEFSHPEGMVFKEFKDVDEDGTDAKWNGIMGDLVSGTAHMSFAALSVSSARSEVIDFSVPYFFSGVSLLAAPQQTSDIPLMAFLLPFSPELWIAIFTSLNITAIAVAIYEWLSPFGLNPWGRQRSKNFSMSSALWVMWGLLCGHLVAFKAPKSWPNKFLINVWGGFSVIFVASYTANIAALIAGLFFHTNYNNYRDSSLLSQRVGTPRYSAAEYYVQKANQLLWHHMRKYSLENVEDGIDRLRNGSLDVLIADTPVLDYYRATDHGCKLQKFGDTINEDTYAIGMTKGFPLKDSISAVIAKYSSNGYMDILQEKWYGGLPCFKLATEIAQPRPLGVAAVTGVFILLGVGIFLGLLILLVEHLFFRYTLPILRDKPKGSIWRSRNIMFFSQKLYRFINCVELVSPHHAARELVHTIRQGQITSLFQKSIKRKEHEQRRRRKSKAQFFEMIQEIRSTIRRQQQEEREPPLESVTEVDCEYSLSPEEKKSRLSPSILRRTFLRSSPKADTVKIKSPTGYFNKQLFSPRSKNKARSSTTLNVRRFSTDSVFNSPTLKLDHGAVVGRRLSKDASAFLSSSPPDINSRRSSYLDIISSGNKLSGKSPVLSIENVSDCSTKSAEPLRKLSDSESIGRKLATLPKYRDPIDRHKLQPQYSLTLGKSDETLMANKAEERVQAAKSFNNVSEGDRSNLSDDEIARRNKQTIQQLQTQLTKKKKKDNTGANNKNSSREDLLVSGGSSSKGQQNTNPQIRIQVEDTSSSREGSKERVRHPPLSRRTKTRHQSLGDAAGLTSSDHHPQPQPPEPAKRNKLGEQSKSLDGNNPGKSRKKRAEVGELPPAPPPPNCSPRNSNGRSPLERLSKEELVLLWRSSESELRSHLLKAIRDKEEPVEPP